MEDFTHFVNSYSYAAYLLIFIYCAVKSGALPLFAGILVSVEALLLLPVCLAAFSGAFFGDELRFYLGRRYGEKIQEKWPRCQKFIRHSTSLLEKYGPAYIFLYRYPKGLRTIGALPVGMTNMNRVTFSILNGSSAILWVTILVGLGVFFGYSIENLASNNWGMYSVLALLIFSAISYFLYRKSVKSLL